MKKIFRLFSLCLICLLMSSCVKYDVNMTVNSDGSVNFYYITAIKKEYESYMNGDDDDYDELKQEGFIVEDYQDDEYKGKKISKYYGSIDDISSEETSASTLTKNDDKFFNVKKSFFKNTYTAKLNASEANEKIDQANMYNNDDDSTQEMKDALSELKFNFNLNLPTKAISSNAQTISADKKHLSWNLMEMNNQDIEFSFELYNINNIILAIGISLIALSIIVLLIKYLLGTKHRFYMAKNK